MTRTAIRERGGRADIDVQRVCCTSGSGARLQAATPWTHLCRQRRCVEVAHLDPLPRAEHARREAERRRGEQVRAIQPASSATAVDDCPVQRGRSTGHSTPDADSCGTTATAEYIRVMNDKRAARCWSPTEYAGERVSRKCRCGRGERTGARPGQSSAGSQSARRPVLDWPHHLVAHTRGAALALVVPLAHPRSCERLGGTVAARSVGPLSRSRSELQGPEPSVFLAQPSVRRDTRVNLPSGARYWTRPRFRYWRANRSV